MLSLAACAMMCCCLLGAAVTATTMMPSPQIDQTDGGDSIIHPPFPSHFPPFLFWYPATLPCPVLDQRRQNRKS
jgi:hypothetical protein